MDSTLINSFSDLIPYAVGGADSSYTEEPASGDPGLLYAVPGQELIDIADAVRLKRDMVSPLRISDIPLQISLIPSEGSSWQTGTFTLDDRTTNIYIPISAPVTMFAWKREPFELLGQGRQAIGGYYIEGWGYSLSLGSNASGTTLTLVAGPSLVAISGQQVIIDCTVTSGDYAIPQGNYRWVAI